MKIQQAPLAVIPAKAGIQSAHPHYFFVVVEGTIGMPSFPLVPVFAGMTAIPSLCGENVVLFSSLPSLCGEKVVFFSSLPLWERGRERGVCNATKNHPLSLYPSPTRGEGLIGSGIT